MPLDLDDGYTLPFSTDPVVRDGVSGSVVHDNLPVVTGKYRPATWEELSAFRYKVNRATSGEQEVRLVAEVIAAHVVAWDVTFRGAGVAPSPEVVRRLPEPVANQLLSIVTRWAPRQGDDEGKSAGGSASGSRSPGGA